MDTSLAKNLAVGAVAAADKVGYSVWAQNPDHLSVCVLRKDRSRAKLPMEPVGGGFFVAEDSEGRAGDRYWFELPGGGILPDVASRFQPEGAHGPSECIDLQSFDWKAIAWKRPQWKGQAIYELHVGAFTEGGTFRSAIEKLDHLCALGVTAVEILPVAEFGGTRNGVSEGSFLYAPAHSYGRPEDFCALIDAAHQRGIAVILDLVINRIGLEEKLLRDFSPYYFHPTRRTQWGPSLNFDGEGSPPVRAFVIGNALYWMDEFRVDGLRVEATHTIADDSSPHLLQEITEEVHRRGGFVIAEDERNFPGLMQQEDGSGFKMDAVLADDFHHQIRATLTGSNHGESASFSGSTRDLGETLRNGWTYIGQPFPSWNGKQRGASGRHLPPEAFIFSIENRDQIDHRQNGERLGQLVSPASFRAASALLCLSPYSPTIFMGQEWAASSPLFYSTVQAGDLGRSEPEGTRREFGISGLSQGIDENELPVPRDENAVLWSRLQWEELATPAHAAVLSLYRALLSYRATSLMYPISRDKWAVRAIGDLLAIRFAPLGGPERLLLCTLKNQPAMLRNDAFVRPPAGCAWKVVIHSEDLKYGGNGWTYDRDEPVVHLRFSLPTTALFEADGR